MRYSGSGIIPIVHINDKKHLVVFVSKSGLLTDAGGRIDLGETTLEASIRELYEESCTLIKLDKELVDKSNFLDIPCGKTFYRVYFCEIVELPKREDFLQLRDSWRFKGDYHFLENTDMTIITIPDKVEDKILDIFSIEWTLHSRLKKILKNTK